jgi:UTP--glucose-1-phosphate uridylyltransferase
MKIRQAVIIAAGRGTRFLPLTRSLPKEMLPLVDRPVIHYAVEEALGSGIEQIIMVTAQGKPSMEDYFDRSLELELFLERKGDSARLNQMRELARLANVCYIRQKEQLGLGHAINTVRGITAGEPFAVILPDDIIESQTPSLRRMIEIYDRHAAGVVAVETVCDADTRKYGIIRPEPAGARVYRVLGLVEKPEPAEAPSRLGIVGRYIFTPRIFDALAETPPGHGGEIQITDAMQRLLEKEAFYAFELEGTRYDTGTPLGWLKANVALALKRPDIGPELREYLLTLL